MSEDIGRSETRHVGQIRFVIESNMDMAAVWHRVTPRARAWQWFSELGVWDTQHNSGVLVYVSFADHRVEIVADRGITEHVADAVWQSVCDAMLQSFKHGDFIGGLNVGLGQITDILVQAFPRVDANANELTNEVLLK
ncbi:TPM domain-containing protein [Snodgrassella sp. CFCC 13594]|uniref:TPM domain-containing protein n=1 Tax=Snodgrassella sp. CFCC 13594 TaxID=1775559 RepID=UPI001E641F90|nr:TPM domain-containing protein [Snodgrassella sp. CFCC 13594]